MSEFTYDPQDWLVTATRCLNGYLTEKFALAINNGDGLNAYDFIMDFPATDDLPKAAEFTKTIIHLGIDDIENKLLGFGDNSPSFTETAATPAVAGTLAPRYAMEHRINFDVGVWATDLSGGVTARLRAYTWLDRFLSGKKAREDLRTATDGGVEIISYMSGRFVNDTINDVRVFRVVGAELVVRVFSYVEGEADVLVDGEPILNPALEITEDSGSLVPLTDES